jgi:hypothetical protein
MRRRELAALMRKSLGSLTMKNLAALITPIAFVWAIGLAILMSDRLVAGDDGGAEREAAGAAKEPVEAIEPAAEAKTQAEALKLAKEQDLPAIAKADKVVITQHFADEASADEEIFAEGRETTIDDEAVLKQIRAALVVKQVEPSGGETKYTLTFYRGDKVVREVWVYAYGEWGITRGNGPDWTLGSNQKLADLLDDLVEKDAG